MSLSTSCSSYCRLAKGIGFYLCRKGFASPVLMVWMTTVILPRSVGDAAKAIRFSLTTLINRVRSSSSCYLEVCEHSLKFTRLFRFYFCSWAAWKAWNRYVGGHIGQRFRGSFCREGRHICRFINSNVRLLIRFAAHCLRQRSQDIVTNLKPVLLPSRDSVDESQLHCRADIGIVSKAIAAGAYCNFELQSLLVFEVLKGAKMRSYQVCSDKHFKWQIWYDTKFMPQQIRTKGHG